MSKGKHAARPLVQVLDAILLTLNALLIVSVAVFFVFTAMTYFSGGSISGGSLLAILCFVFLGIVLGIGDYAIRKSLEYIDPRPNKHLVAQSRAIRAEKKSLREQRRSSDTEHAEGPEDDMKQVFNRIEEHAVTVPEPTPVDTEPVLQNTDFLDN
jgi:hypothetical protein